MSNRNIKDIVGSVLFGALGLYVLVTAPGLGLGTAQNMGPGYFPMLLGAALLLMSGGLFVSALATSGSLPEIQWRPLVSVLASIAAFALAFRFAGLVPAIFLTVCVAALGDREARLLHSLALAVVISLLAWLIFRVGLGLPMPAFRRLF